MLKQNDQESIYQEEGTMSKKDGYSRPGLFGSINHYDSKGHKIGERAGQGFLVGIMIMMQKVIRSEKKGQNFLVG